MKKWVILTTTITVTFLPALFLVATYFSARTDSNSKQFGRKTIREVHIPKKHHMFLPLYESMGRIDEKFSGDYVIVTGDPKRPRLPWNLANRQSSQKGAHPKVSLPQAARIHPDEFSYEDAIPKPVRYPSPSQIPRIEAPEFPGLPEKQISTKIKDP